MATRRTKVPAKKPSTSSRKKAAAREALAPVDVALATAWKDAERRMTEAATAEAAQFDARFEAVDDILRGDLYLAGGFESARAFIAARLPGMTEETVRDYAKVARHFTARDIELHTRSRLAVLVHILEAQQGAELPRRLRIRPEVTSVPVRVGRRVEDRPFVELDVRALKQAARALVKRGAGARPRGESPLVAALRKSLRDAGSRAGARLEGGLVTLSGIEPSELQRVCTTLGRDRALRDAIAALDV